jgi:hypothetical protein
MPSPARSRSRIAWLAPVIIAALVAFLCRAAVRGIAAGLSETHAAAGRPLGRPLRGVVVVTNCNAYLHTTAISLAEEV